jgi:hypothetical protein
VPSSPPASFPVYGLQASWPGARWIDGFGDKIGDPPRWLALAHQSADGRSLIMVNTYSAVATDAQSARSGRQPLSDVAFDAAHMLVNLTLPVQSVPRPDGFLPALTEHALRAAGQYAQWPTTPWRVDGAAVAARRWQFAGGWAAASDAVDHVYLVAVGVGPEPEDLSLTRLLDGIAYHADLTRPLSPALLSASRQAAGAQSEDPRWQRHDWHPDHVRLMRALPSA